MPKYGLRQLNSSNLIIFKDKSAHLYLKWISAN